MAHVEIDKYFSLFLKGFEEFSQPDLSLIVPLRYFKLYTLLYKILLTTFKENLHFTKFSAKVDTNCFTAGL